MSERSFYLLAYDITDDRRRAKIAKICESVAERVQGSVFEGYFTPLELQQAIKRTTRHFDKEEDSLRVYQLCAACREKVVTHGRGKVISPPSSSVIV